MKPLNSIKDMLASFFSMNGNSWWVEVTTAKPSCTYYFGPFQNHQEAEMMRPAYIEDLEMEEAKEIQAVIKRCKPDELTVFDEQL